MKRKADAIVDTRPLKRRDSDGSPLPIQSAFRKDLFDDSTLTSYRDSYKTATAYPHAVVSSLIEDSLLRNVRNEIKEHIHFTLKETDIYRIHQSGDLANLSNLDAESLRRLPSLVRLRDALYSPDFREWVSNVTGAGKLSGSKTDMAVNVYTPGSYLLCHDDVIGSRRVSYILYLTDPDQPWKKHWGGGLRLYPTETRNNKAGEEIKVPLAEHSLKIPPSFGQLSFFAVRPGESYHDVEEVYHAGKEDQRTEDDGGRIRMAISGWYHIPQEGENGFQEGVEEALAQRSSLAQLKGAANEFDEPQAHFRHYDEPRTVMNSSATKQEIDPGDDSDQNEGILTEQDLTFLLKYISPSFLTPDMIDQFSSSFAAGSFLQLEKFLREPFAKELRDYINQSEAEMSLPHWRVARPPHKHRYAYLQSTEALHRDDAPTAHLLADLVHSHAFKKWLALVTGLKAHSLIRQNVVARRFRRGKDYALASSYTGEQPQLEFTIGITPSSGWEKEEDDHPVTANGANAHPNGHESSSYNHGVQVSTLSHPEPGGEEVYMAGDEDETASTTSKSHLPHVGKKTDPAVYKSAGDDEDDGILFTNAPAWSTFSVVLRDKGTLRFVKYVSSAARGDRWDVKGEVELGQGAFDGETDANEDGLVVDKDDESGEDEDEDEDLYDSDPNHYFEDYERERAMEEHTTTDEDEDEDQ